MRSFLLLAVMLINSVGCHAGPKALKKPPECSSLLPYIDSPQISDAVETVESSSVAFSLPKGFSREKFDSPDSEELEWQAGHLTVGYAYSRSLGGFSAPDSKSTVCNILIQGANTPAKITQSDSFVRVQFKDAVPKNGTHVIVVRSANLQLRNTMLRNAIDSLRFVNFWNNLVIVSISDDSSTFVFANEIGAQKIARVGDIITRDSGVVVSVEARQVIVRELLPEDEGGYVEIERTLRKGTGLGSE